MSDFDVPGVGGGGSGGSWTHISTTSASNDATVEITSGLDGYHTFAVVFHKVRPATNAVEFRFRLSQDGGSTWDTTSSYHSSVLRFQSNGPFLTLQSAQSSQLLATTISNHSLNNLNGTMYLYNLPSTTERASTNSDIHLNGDSGGFSGDHQGVGYYFGADSDASDGIQFYMSSGNISSGDFLLYGRTELSI